MFKTWLRLFCPILIIIFTTAFLFQNCEPSHSIRKLATKSLASNSTYAINSLPKYRPSLLTKIELKYIIQDLFKKEVELDSSELILKEISVLPDLAVDLIADATIFSENNPAKMTSELYLSQLADIEEALFNQYSKNSDFRNFCSENKPPRACLGYMQKEIIEKLWRRPLIREEFEIFVSLFASNEPLEEKAKLAFITTFLAPQFYIKNYHPLKGANQVITYSQYALASRISFFIYNSVPDAELLVAAGRGLLTKPEEISRQVNRILTQPTYLNRFVTHTLSIWLGIDRDILSNAVLTNDKNAKAKLSEVALAEYNLLLDFVSENKSLQNFLNSNYVYLNSAIAEYLNIDESTLAKIGLEKSNPTVTLKKISTSLLGYPFGGYFQGAHFASKTKSSLDGGLKTLVSQRGKYVAEKFFCFTIPPNALTSDDITRVLGPSANDLNQIQVGEIRSQHASCTSCHGVVDRLGMGFEFRDAFGRTRTKYSNGTAISIRFSLSNNQESLVTNFDEFMGSLASDPRVHSCFIKTISNKVALMNADAQSSLIKELLPVSQTLGVKDLVSAIIASPLFTKSMRTQ